MGEVLGYQVRMDNKLPREQGFIYCVYSSPEDAVRQNTKVVHSRHLGRDIGEGHHPNPPHHRGDPPHQTRPEGGADVCHTECDPVLLP